MSQNNYELRIVETLLKKDNHIRGIAKELRINQMTVSRKIRELYKENVTDYKQEGKNKVFFIKKTLEAKQYAYLTEITKVLGAIKKYPVLRTIIESIAKKTNIKLAIIFGSYAKGKATGESDIDLYAETTDNKIKEEIAQINTKLSVKTGNYDKQSLLIKEIEKNHLIIKGIEEYYEKTRFFE